MNASLSISPWEDWQSASYFDDYFGLHVAPDEQAAIRFQIEFLQSKKHKFARALEFGCGPTVMRAIAASEYIESLDMAEWLEDNLQQISLWAANEPEADDWSHFTEYVLSCEGRDMFSRDDVLAREQLTRNVISEIIQTNAHDLFPLGKQRVASYDLLISSFCLDCLSPCKDTWRKCMKNVFGLLKPGGSFTMMALRDCKGYLVGNHWFPGANISRKDLESALLLCGANPASLRVTEYDVPDHASQGYQGILLASGETLI